SAGPVVAFPLYLAVVLLVSLQQDRAESVTVAGVAAIAVLIRPLAAAGQASEVAPAVLLAAVLVAVASAMNERTRHSREGAAAAAFIARIPNAAAGGASLLVQLADISARSRADQLRDCAGAVRQIIVTAVGLEGALPQLLGAFCDQLDWDVAQYWSPDADGQSMRARQA